MRPSLRALWKRAGRGALAELFPAPASQWTDEYARRHAEFVAYVLDSRELVGVFAGRERLPAAYGVGFDERVVEYPWVLSQSPAGRTLDAGSTLNHEHVLSRFQPQVGELHIVTLAPEPVSFPERGISYVYADVRALPYRDGYFDTVVSISVLEHVGMDTTYYGVSAPAAPEPDRELRRAVEELARVTAPGGTLLVTVPYGAREDHGWFRQFDEAGVRALASFAAPLRADVSVYRYSKRGWQVSDLAGAAGSRYQDHRRSRMPAPDLAAAARAVACIRMEL